MQDESNEKLEKENSRCISQPVKLTSSTHRRDGSFASSRTPFIKDLKPFSGEIRYGW